MDFGYLQNQNEARGFQHRLPAKPNVEHTPMPPTLLIQKAIIKDSSFQNQEGKKKKGFPGMGIYRDIRLFCLDG